MENTQDNPGKGLGIASLICGIAGLITFGLSAIVGLILGIISMKKSAEVDAPKGLALAGVIISAVMLLGGLGIGVGCTLLCGGTCLANCGISACATCGQGCLVCPALCMEGMGDIYY